MQDRESVYVEREMERVCTIVRIGVHELCVCERESESEFVGREMER